jgi:DNA-binding NtrC family response regulator
VRKGVLIVDPDPLLRWSVATYLSRWFDVVPVESAVAAARALGRRRIDVVLVSDTLLQGGGELVERATLANNAAATVVHMVANVPRAPSETRGRCIEKPFQLPTLARLLGIEDP